jgi:hypothetical protein
VLSIHHPAPRAVVRIALIALTLVAAVVVTPRVARASGTVTATITNFDSAGDEVTLFDTDGNAVDIHEPYLTEFNGVYYLYGTAMGCGSLSTIPAHTPWCGDKVYSSTDLTNWTYDGLLFNPGTAEWQNRCGLSNPMTSTQSSCFRPRVIYDAATGKYVLWVNFGVNPNDNPANPVTGKYYVLTSSSPTGPFIEVGAATTAKPWDNDETLFVDPATGDAYVIYMMQSDHSLVVEQLNSSFTSGTGNYSLVSTTTLNGTNSSEAPSMFVRNGTYYLVYSTPACGFCSSGVDTEYKTASSPTGPWSAPAQISSGTSGASDFCGGQSSSVSPVVTTSGTDYLWQFDEWHTGGSSPATSNLFMAPLTFNGNGSIQQMNCSSYPTVTLTLPAGGSSGSFNPAGLDQSSGQSGFYEHCDIDGTRVRAQSFTPSAAAAGQSVTVAVNVDQQGVPNQPLILDLYAAGSSGEPTGPLLASSSTSPSGVPWSSRTVTVLWPGPVAAGQSYVVTVSSTTSQGCYSVQFHNGSAYSAGTEHFSNNSGSTWSAAEPYTLKFFTLIGPNPGVTPGSSSSAAYTFDEAHGTTAGDSTGSGNTATLLGGADWAPSWNAADGDSALSLNGASAFAEVPRPVIDTSQSFTVSAWVNLSTVDDNAYVASSIDGNQASSFYLEYCGFCGAGAFDFTMTNSDSANPTAVRATGTTQPTAGTWYHLVGVYNASAHTISLYVGSTLEATASYTSAWRATGPTAIGRGKFNGALSNFWPGILDDVRFNAGVLPPS